MPERLYSTMNLHDADVDSRVPSLDIELEESNVDRDIANRVQRIHLAEKLSCLQDLPPLAVDSMQGINNYMQSSSIAGSTQTLIQSAHDYIFTTDAGSPFQHDAMPDGTFSHSNDSIPIYTFNNSENVSNGSVTYKDNYSHVLNEAYPTPQEQPMPVINFTDGLMDLDVGCALQNIFNSFPSHTTKPYSATNDDSEMRWLGVEDNTPVFKVPANPRTPPRKQQASRNNSWPGNDSSTEIDELVTQFEPFNTRSSNQICYNTSTPLVMGQQTSTHHRRASSMSNITQFTGDNTMAYQMSQSLPLSLSANSRDAAALPIYSQQHQQHLSRSPQRQPPSRKRSKSLSKKKRHPYPHREPTNSTRQIKMISASQVNSMLALSGIPTQHSSNHNYSSKMVDSHSVPSSPCITSNHHQQQQLDNSLPPITNFTYDHVMPSSSGLSKEMRDEQEKTEAFSRLHQGLHLWEFLLEVLLSNDYQPILKWTDKEKGIFKVVDSEALARFWGDYRRKPKMNYDKMSRAIRYYYDKDILDKFEKRLHYQFKYHSHWWEKLQKIDPTFKITHIPQSNIPPPNTHDIMIADDDIILND